MNRTPVHPAHDDPQFAANVRRLLTTMTADAPPAPDFDQRDELVLLPKVVEINRHPRRALVGVLAIAAAIAAGAIALTRHDPSESQGTPPAVVNPAPGATMGLPAHVLPAFVPPGWDLVDIREGYSLEPDSSFVPTQLFRRTDGAAVRLRIERDVAFPEAALPADVSVTTAVDAVAQTGAAPAAGGEPPTTTPPSRTALVVTNGSGEFVESETYVAVEAVGISDVEVTAFVRNLHPDRTGELLRFDVVPGQPFQLESEILPPQVAPNGGSYGSLSYLIDGKRGWSIDVRPLSSLEEHAFGVPTTVDGVTLYVGTRETIREPISGLVVRAQHWDEDPAVIANVLASIRIVDGSQWLRKSSRLADRWLATETVQELKIGTVTLSSHRDGIIRPLCVVRDGARTCHLSVGVDVSPDQIFSDTWGPFDVGDHWVYAGVHTGFHDPVAAMLADIDHGTPQTAWVTKDGEVLYGFVLPDAATGGSYTVDTSVDGSGESFSGYFSLPII